ncbi:GNAT family N-acetyltransferase [soil metagenome]
MSDLTVRLAEGDDIALGAALRWRWISEDTPGAVPLNSEDFARALLDWARDHHQSHRLFLALDGDEPVGMAWIALTARVPSPITLNRINADVQSVYVAPEARGRGVATALMRYALDWATDAGAEFARVHSSTMAIPLYQAVDFAASPNLMERRLR